MRQDLPTWSPQPLERMLSDALLSGWSDEDKKQLLLVLGGSFLLNYTLPVPPESETEPQTILMEIHTWWEAVKISQRAEYLDRTYPKFFTLSQLKDPDNRPAWFTMFALACFQSFGRTQDGQHRVYLERGQTICRGNEPSLTYTQLLEAWTITSK
jgi:hypothetical protein